MSRRNRSKLASLACLVMLTALLLTTVSAQDQGAKDPSEPIKNVQFQAADIHSVLTFLADYGGVNVIIAPDVDGTVTIRLKNVHWRTAMDIIGRTYGLAVLDEQEGYVRVLRSETYRKELTEQSKHVAQQHELVPLETRIVRLKNSTAMDMVGTVESLMTDRGSAAADQRSNSLILKEVPSKLDELESYIQELDAPSHQIKISAQLLEISNTDLQEMGIDWSAEGSYQHESGREYNQSGEINANRVTNSAATYTVGLVHHGWSAEAVVDMLVSNGKGKIIAHPEITTLENQEARIQMGQKVPVKQYDESGNVVIQFEEVGTILTVTPHIASDNQILMHLEPERSTYEYDPNGVIINTNNAETWVIVDNGQTAVIGGLTTQDEVENEIGVPLLKDIPLLGNLFKYTSKRVESRDLVIFVTPTIVGTDFAATPAPNIDGN